MHGLRQNHFITFQLVDYDIDLAEPKQWRASVQEADILLQKLLQDKNGSRTMLFGVTGHSHMDTAWMERNYPVPMHFHIIHSIGKSQLYQTAGEVAVSGTIKFLSSKIKIAVFVYMCYC